MQWNKILGYYHTDCELATGRYCIRFDNFIG